MLPDQGINAFPAHVTSGLGHPLLVLLNEHGAHEAENSFPVWKDTDDIGASADLPVQLLLRIIGPDLLPVLLGKGRIGENLIFGF